MTKLSRNHSSSRRGNVNKTFDCLPRPPFSLFQSTLHCLLCIAALLVGFRLSREALLVVNSLKLSHGSVHFEDARNRQSNVGTQNDAALVFPYIKDDRNGSELKSTRVHVGRHEILIRPWPHPDPVQTLLAHRLLGQVQEEQRRTFGLRKSKQLLVITPTYVRTFQEIHLTGLIHTLRLIPWPLIWIVVEAGGISNETAALLASSKLPYHHLGTHATMPVDWKQRERLETRLRCEGLRFIGEQELDGIVLFADDSNTYSLDFFDEAQNVNWIGSFSVGLLSPSAEFSKVLASSSLREANMDQALVDSNGTKERDIHLKGVLSSFEKDNYVLGNSLPLQAPVCDSSGHVMGWYSPIQEGQKQDIGSASSLKWAGFALNARMFWKEYKKPLWMKSWTELVGEYEYLLETPLAFVKNASVIEPLGRCGRDVLMWWLQEEARYDSKFPPRWVLIPPLDVVVPSKRTPWLEHASVTRSLPPPPAVLPSVSVDQHLTKKRRNKAAKGKRGANHTRQSKGKMDAGG